jgi:lysine-N-methylase
LNAGPPIAGLAAHLNRSGRRSRRPRGKERQLSEPRPIRAEYSENFRCIRSACEDTCCQGWGLPIDQATYEKYRILPASPLRNLIQISCLITAKGTVCTDGSGQKVREAAVFAKIRMTPANQCPLLSHEGLCRIHTELGAEFLSDTCATYPRMGHSIDGIEEKALALSCPEAARLVLLNPCLLSSLHPVSSQPVSSQPLPGHAPPADSRHDKLPGNAVGDPSSFRSWFWPIREAVIGLIRNRTYALWQRLFLLGILCRRLDSMAKGELEYSLSAFLGEFESSIASGALRTSMEAMETLRGDCALQLDIVLQLAGMALRDSSVNPRFVNCVEDFKTGIGNSPGATLASLTAQYAQAHDQFYAPFFDRHPYILENYLINTIVRCQFPLRRSVQGGESPIAREYALLTAQFALMKGLLIGIAGCHSEEFSADQVVHTVQAASRHFEHHPDFLNQAHALLVESQMDGARGLAILLRNTTATASPAGGKVDAAAPLAQAS